ncbi:transketolase [Anaerobium acetethylicum]|uniref:Transketolase n=1 Tax=Anaerobium acetethylicum TaxID=1619234 RepID=A0A1D3TW61_9FIRM|nr:transketolase [Anaerobium acetethylicum]SCP98412.1 transketolase [Anaerobium acetethylicum]
MKAKILKQTKLLAAKMRRYIIEEVYSAKSGHPGGSLSCADFIATLYDNHMNVDSKKPKDINRDRFVLSKGHCAPALYAALALKGFFPIEDLKTFRGINSYLQGHPNMNSVPGVDMSTGSLGQGISTAVGMALVGKREEKNYKVYTVLGDGEIEEGQVWEAAMCAAHYQLDNLCAFLDYNGLQIDGNITDVMNPEKVADKFKAFNWNVIECNGNDIVKLNNAISKANQYKGRPTIIIGKTTKGKGVSFMEGKYQWHGSVPNQEQYEQACQELNAVIAELEG